MLELILADQLADVLPLVGSSGQEWQYDISTVRTHIGRSSGRSTPQQWHLVVKNGNMTFLLLELILADQLADLPPSSDIWWKSLKFYFCMYSPMMHVNLP